MSRVAKAALFGALGVTVILGGLYAYLTHGWLWSIYVPIYSRLLQAIPFPPGVVQGTEATTLNPELPWGYMQYEVNRPHDQSVTFFESHLPDVGWALLEQRGWTNGQGYLRVDRMLYWRRGKYWLIVSITTRVSPDGAALEPSHVYLEVHRYEQEATGRY